MRLLCLVTAVAVSACEPPKEMTPEPVSFAEKIRPIFDAKCNACHYAGNLSTLDLTRPFSENGLINRTSIWVNARQSILVVPGAPDSSLLMTKIDPSLEIDPAKDGDRMPTNMIADVTDAERADIRTWIQNGAMNDAFFQSNVQPVFGTAANLGRAIGKCSYCHTATSLYSPDLVNVFSARGLVNVDSALGGKRVAPGNPDESALMKKIAASVPASQGQKMPLNYPQLTSDEIALVRTWISEGAQDN